MDEDSPRKVPRFSGKRHEDFTLWMMRIEALLESKELLNLVLEDAVGEETIDALPMEVKQNLPNARMYLVPSLGDKPLRAVASERHNPFVMYRKLCERYATENAATRVQLQTKLHQTRFTEVTVMSDYVDDLESVFSRLEAMGSPIGNSMQIAILFSSFVSTRETPYRPVISALQTLSDEELSWEKVTARLLQEYDTSTSETKTEGSGPAGLLGTERALQAKVRGRCFKCGRKGHYKPDCRSVKPDHRAGHPSTHRALVSRQGDHQFIVDSGATSHMIGDRALAHLFHCSQHRAIVLCDGRGVTASRTGHLVLMYRSLEDAM